MTAEPLTAARDLGARGSRAPLGDADPAGPLPWSARQVIASLPTWWEARARESGLSGKWLDLTQAVEGIEGPLWSVAAGVEPLPRESACGMLAEDLGEAYTAALDPGVRSRHGRHYTPRALSSHLWQMSRRELGYGVRSSALKGLARDPACGAGALLIPPLREHVRASVRVNAQVALRGLPNLVEGIDSDPAAVLLANVLLAAEALPLLAAVPAVRRRPLPRLARVGDGLAPDLAPARLTVMNPPYGRVRLAPDERERWSEVLYGHANLYSLFMASALDGMESNSVLASLVPTSFTSGLYFSRLRARLSRHASLREICFVADRDGSFSGVLQETCLAIFTRRARRRTYVGRFEAEAEAVASVPVPKGEGPWLLPRRADDAVAAGAAGQMTLSLRNLGYRCSTGPLVWNRRSEDLSSKRSGGSVPVLWAADIDGGRLHQDPARDRFRYLTLRGRDQDVLVLDEPCVLVQRTTAPEQTKRLVVANCPAEAIDLWGGRVVIENHVNVLRPTIPEPLLDLATLARVLSTETMDRVVRCLTGSVAVSAYELEAIPFPAADVLASWRGLSGAALERAVSLAYRPEC